MKKKKLNSKNPKYWDKSLVTGPVIKERKLMKEGNGFKMYFVYYKQCYTHAQYHNINTITNG